MHWLRALNDRFHLSQLIGLEMSKTLKKGGTNPGNLSQTLEIAQKKHFTCNSDCDTCSLCQVLRFHVQMQWQQAKHAGFLLKGAARVITAHGRRGDG